MHFVLRSRFFFVFFFKRYAHPAQTWTLLRQSYCVGDYVPEQPAKVMQLLATWLKVSWSLDVDPGPDSQNFLRQWRTEGGLGGLEPPIGVSKKF